MIPFQKPVLLAALLAATASAALTPAQAQQASPSEAPRVSHETADKAEESDIAKESQNPIGNLTILPFENYANFDYGPNKGAQNVLEFEPVVPFHITDDWNVITRAVIPTVWTPSLAPAKTPPTALAPTDFSAFFSPSHSIDGWTWGVGPIMQIPTATNPAIGSSVWGLGPTAVVVKTTEHVVAGLLVNNVTSLGGTSGRFGTRYGQFLAQPFFNYNFGQGWFVTTAPIITDNEYSSGKKWTVPVGAEAGRVIRLGKLPVKLSLGAYYNAIRPEYGSTWTLKTVVAIIF